MDLKPFLDSGELKNLNSSKNYKLEDIFDANVIKELLQQETQQALQEGFRALKIINEMPWTLQGLLDADQLREYDTKLNEFFPNKNCSTTCLYNVSRFDPDWLWDILTTHPCILVGNEIFDNYYYLKPADFLG